MGEWKKVKLGDCLKEVVEKTTENNQYEVLTSSKDGIFSQEEYFDKQVASKNNVGYKIIKKGQFTYRSMSDSGRFTINRLDNRDIGIVSPAYPVFEAKEINSDYLKYFWDSEMFRKAIHNLSQGSTRTALKYKDLIEIEMFIPSIEEQEKIVEILEKVDLVIEKYERLLEEKSQFIKSKFVEMFGNNKYEQKNLKDIANIGSSKRIYANEYKKNGIPFYRSKEIRELGSGLKPSTELFISKEKYNEVKQKYGIPKKGDILIAAIGATIGYMWIVDDSEFYYKDGNLILISSGRGINPIYLKYTLEKNIDQFKRNGASGSAQLAMTIEKVEKFIISIPPIELQNKFAELVKNVDKQKFALEKIIENYKKLKKGLMQQLLTGKIKVKI